MTQIAALEGEIARYTKRKKMEVFPYYFIGYLLSLEEIKSEDEIRLTKQ